MQKRFIALGLAVASFSCAQNPPKENPCPSKSTLLLFEQSSGTTLNVLAAGSAKQLGVLQLSILVNSAHTQSRICIPETVAEALSKNSRGPSAEVASLYVRKVVSEAFKEPVDFYAYGSNTERPATGPKGPCNPEPAHLAAFCKENPDTRTCDKDPFSRGSPEFDPAPAPDDPERRFEAEVRERCMAKEALNAEDAKKR